jgi:ferrous iron transport protein A
VNLAQIAVGEAAIVTSIGLDPGEADWLRAVGLFEGTHLQLLRRAPFGGPLHVRTGAGAEFAIDRGLARSVAVKKADHVHRPGAPTPELL